MGVPSLASWRWTDRIVSSTLHMSFRYRRPSPLPCTTTEERTSGSEGPPPLDVATGEVSMDSEEDGLPQWKLRAISRSLRSELRPIENRPPHAVHCTEIRLVVGSSEITSRSMSLRSPLYVTAECLSSWRTMFGLIHGA
eukprot:5605874-Prymnesium_polylepis.4